MTITILNGDCREVLRTLPDESVHCVVTSPPYWGLRDYGTATWEGGDPGCEHKQDNYDRGERANRDHGGRTTPFLEMCGKCGARRIDSQIGLESTYTEYVETMVAVFREVRRVLRRDGTLWLNLGDSYASTSGSGQCAKPAHTRGVDTWEGAVRGIKHGLKPKDLCGIPWRVAFALQADSWYLRQDIIWSKPNPMPESVTDRCTRAHEYVFLLSKSARYYFDAEAIREPIKSGSDGLMRMAAMDGYRSLAEGYTKRRPQREVRYDEIKGANRRSVWEIATAPFSGAHFATFPPALIEPCIKAGTSEKGCCAKCGAPWVRETKTEYRHHEKWFGDKQDARHSRGKAGTSYDEPIGTKTVGWSPSCSCLNPGYIEAVTVPCTVLDPFGGAGTTGLVADRLGRNAILIELNPEYAAMAESRLKNDAGMFADVAFPAQNSMLTVS